MLYRKKPVVVEARQFTVPLDGDETSNKALAAWCGGVLVSMVDGTKCIAVSTLEGVMRATYGDYIIKGVQGEFYPCKPSIFEETYEPAE